MTDRRSVISNTLDPFKFTKTDLKFNRKSIRRKSSFLNLIKNLDKSGKTDESLFDFDFDKVREYKFYFPLNNYTNVCK